MKRRPGRVAALLSMSNWRDWVADADTVEAALRAPSAGSAPSPAAASAEPQTQEERDAAKAAWIAKLMKGDDEEMGEEPNAALAALKRTHAYKVGSPTYQRGIDLSCLLPEGEAPAEGDGRVRSILKEAPLSTTVTDETGLTPLMVAIARRQKDAVRVLLEMGDRRQLTTPSVSFERTPLQEAAATGDPELVQMLLDAKCDPNGVDAAQQTALHFAALRGDVACCELLATPEALRQRRADNATALHIAILSGHDTLALRLVELGASVTQAGQYENTALHWALLERRGELASRLAALTPERQLDAKNEDGDTALHVASAARWGEMVELLVLAGADDEARNLEGETPHRLRDEEAKSAAEAEPPRPPLSWEARREADEWLRVQGVSEGMGAKLSNLSLDEIARLDLRALKRRGIRGQERQGLLAAVDRLQESRRRLAAEKRAWERRKAQLLRRAALVAAALAVAFQQDVLGCRALVAWPDGSADAS